MPVEWGSTFQAHLKQLPRKKEKKVKTGWEQAIQDLQWQLNENKEWLTSRLEKMDSRVNELKSEVNGLKENLADVYEFILNGCCEDTSAYYQIKIRHLIKLVQVQLAYHSGLSQPEAGEHDVYNKWHKKYSPISQLSLDEQVERAKQALLSTNNSEQICIRLGDAAAHPGALTAENANSYRVAVHAIYSDKPDTEKHLGKCIDYLLLVSP